MNGRRRWRLAGSVAWCGLRTADSLSVNTRMQAGSSALPARTQITSLCSSASTSALCWANCNNATVDMEGLLITATRSYFTHYTRTISWILRATASNPPALQICRCAAHGIYSTFHGRSLKCPQRKFTLLYNRTLALSIDPSAAGRANIIHSRMNAFLFSYGNYCTLEIGHIDQNILKVKLPIYVVTIMCEINI